MPKKKKSYKQKNEEFKRSLDRSGFSSRQAIKDLADLIYTESVNQRTAKKSSSKKEKTETKTKDSE